tara:strand:- start:155 stop:448 length:294 start_codon:yes stop_codon:yes gene_type:complete
MDSLFTYIVEHSLIVRIVGILGFALWFTAFVNVAQAVKLTSLETSSTPPVGGVQILQHISKEKGKLVAALTFVFLAVCIAVVVLPDVASEILVGMNR